VSELRDPAVDNPAENQTPAAGQAVAEHGAGVTVRRQEQAAQPVDDPFRRDSGSQDSGRQGSGGQDRSGAANGPQDAGRQSSADHGNGGQGHGLDSHSSRGGTPAGPDTGSADRPALRQEQAAQPVDDPFRQDSGSRDSGGQGSAGGPDQGAGEQHGQRGAGNEHASANAAAGSYDGQPAGQAEAGLDGGSADDGSSDVGADAATVDGQPIPGSTFAAGREQGVTEPDARQGGEELDGAEPGPGGVVPGAGLEGISGQPDAGTGVIGEVDPASADDAGNGGLRGPFGSAVTGVDASAGDTGEQGGESGDGRGVPGKPGTESPSQEQQGGENGKAADAKGGEEPTLKDQAIIQNPVPEAEVVHENDASSEASPDQNAEDPRWAAVMSAIGDLQAQNQKLEKQQAESDAKLDTMQAKVDESEARADKLESQHEEDQAKIKELESRLESTTSSEADTGKDPDKVKAAQQRSDRPPQGTKDPDTGADGNPPERGTLLEGHEATDQEAAAKRTPVSRIRRAVTSDRVGAIAVAAGAVNTAAEFGLHATPDGAIGLTILGIGLAAKGLGKLEKRGKEKK
jgi:hypothetical protein